MAGKTGIHGLMILLLAGAVTPAAAEPEVDPSLYRYSAQSQIEDLALSNARGVIGVNLSAGDSNAQINARALAASAGLGIASASTHTQQQVRLASQVPDSAISQIEGQAFSNSRGLISVNHVSGSGNAQVNALAISVAAAGLAVSENELSMTVSGQSPTQNDSTVGTQHREATIDAKAFSDTKGVVQINQLAGSGNATSNSFGLSVSLGATP